MTSTGADPTAPTRKLVANFFVTLDGVVESPDQWQFPYFNEEMGEAVGVGFAASDAMLMGGTLYREWSQYWPGSTDQPMADTINGIPKYVVSRTLDRVDWSNSTLLRGDDVAERIRELKARPGKDIAMSGSAVLTRWLLAEGLVDELHLLVHPLVVGSGRRLFEDGMPRQPLELVSAQTFGTGVVHLTYRPAAA
jgi:dihydrofolate reductase